MDPANKREAIREVLIDCAEGADIIMVKPALPYLDVIASVRSKVNVPVAAYQVSGEYAMIKAAEKNGWLDGDRAMEETIISIRRPVRYDSDLLRLAMARKLRESSVDAQKSGRSAKRK